MIQKEIKKNDIKVYYRCGPRILVSEDERKTVVEMRLHLEMTIVLNQ